MTRKFALAALAVAALAAGPIFTTEAEAKNGRRAGLAIGVAAGIGGLIIGSAIANAHPRGYGETRYHAEPRHRGHGFRTVNAYHVDQDDCFEKPIRRFDPYAGRVVVVGSKVVCR